MRAVVITSYGGVEGIGVQEVDTPPAATADRVRVRVHAAGLNRADILQRRGLYPAPPGYPSNIQGMEFAGEVESIGEAVRAWKVGDRVFGITGGSGEHTRLACWRGRPRLRGEAAALILKSKHSCLSVRIAAV